MPERAHPVPAAPEGHDGSWVSRIRATRTGPDDEHWNLPYVHILLLGVAVFATVVGGTVTFGSWGEFSTRLAMAYLMPAIVLHAWSVMSPTPRVAARVAAWLLVIAMCIHTRALLRPVLLGTIGLLALFDVSIHASRLDRAKVSVGARIGAAITALVAAAGVGLLFYYAADVERAARTSASVVLTGALFIAAFLYPGMREPARLLPALGVNYLAFVLLAAPVLPIGPALAWWMLCASVFFGVVVSARHTTAPEAPPSARRHEHRVERLPDPTVASFTSEVERFVATGSGGRGLSERIERATGRPVTGATLPGLVTAISKGTYPSRADRERALKELLEVNE